MPLFTPQNSFLMKKRRIAALIFFFDTAVQGIGAAFSGWFALLWAWDHAGKTPR